MNGKVLNIQCLYEVFAEDHTGCKYSTLGSDPTAL